MSYFKNITKEIAASKGDRFDIEQIITDVIQKQLTYNESYVRLLRIIPKVLGNLKPIAISNQTPTKTTNKEYLKAAKQAFDLAKEFIDNGEDALYDASEVLSLAIALYSGDIEKARKMQFDTVVREEFPDHLYKVWSGSKED